jgi:hypothetical protein
MRQRPTTLSLLALLALAPGCERVVSVTFTAGALSGKCDLPSVVGAEGSLDNSAPCPLARKAGADKFEGSCEVTVESSNVTVKLRYYRSETPDKKLTLAEAARTVDIGDADASNLVFAAKDLRYDFDEDGDGVLNIYEHCSGRKIAVSDAPVFDQLKPELGALTTSGRFAIGERVRVPGKRLPSKDLIAVKLVAPKLRDTAPSDLALPILNSPEADDEIVVQIPPGIDVGQKATLAVESLGLTASYDLDIVRLQMVANLDADTKGDKNPARVELTERKGKYSLTKPPDKTIAISGTGAPLAECDPPILQDVSSDGRHLVFLCAKQEPMTVHVMELPTGSLWTSSLTGTKGGSAALAAGDSRLAIFHPPTASTPAKVSLHPVQWKDRKLGGSPLEKIVDSARVMAVGGANDESLFFYICKPATEENVTRYSAINLSPDKSAALTPLSSDCDAAVAVLRPLDANVVFVSRPKASQLARVDLGGGPTRTRSHALAGALDLSGDKLLVANNPSPKLTLQLCVFGGADLQLIAACHDTMKTGSAPNLVVAPEGTSQGAQAFFTLADPYLISCESWSKCDIASVGGSFPQSVLIQP